MRGCLSHAWRHSPFSPASRCRRHNSMPLPECNRCATTKAAHPHRGISVAPYEGGVSTIASLGLVAGSVLLGGAVSIHLFVTSSQSALLAVELGPVTDGVDLPLAIEDVVTDARDRRAPRARPGGTADLYGNDVTDAVAEYALDAAGSLHELHSPQTELPRLGIPKG